MREPREVARDVGRLVYALERLIGERGSAAASVVLGMGGS